MDLWRNYDKAGNLTRRTNNLFEQWFNINYLDQITGINRSNKLTVVGTTFGAATNVTVNTSNATRYADNTFASTNHTLVNGTNTFTAVALDAYGRTDSSSVSLNLPITTSFVYDLAGNLLFDGNYAYAYDDENELTSVIATNAWKSEFGYDGKMRRRVRKEYTWQSGAWVLTNEVHYIYDGNLVIQERDALNAPVVTYSRGKDLSGSFEGAGGIGGLLARTDDREGTTAFYHADRLGNITILINAQQIPVSKYLYDPFGNTLSSSGPLADGNSYRFSSKELHANSGLSYYLYRFYSPRLQRWISRDPVLEQGHKMVRDVRIYEEESRHPYQFLDNNCISFYDAFGLAKTEDDYLGRTELQCFQCLYPVNPRCPPASPLLPGSTHCFYRRPGTTPSNPTAFARCAAAPLQLMKGACSLGNAPMFMRAARRLENCYNHHW